MKTLQWLTTRDALRHLGVGRTWLESRLIRDSDKHEPGKIRTSRLGHGVTAPLRLRADDVDKILPLYEREKA